MNLSRIIEYRFNKFIITGFINTLFGYVVFSLLIYLNLEYKIALFMSYLFGIIFNFITYKFFVFNVPFNIKRLVRYLIVYIVTYNINLYLLSFFFEIFRNYYVSQIFVLPIIVLLTWFLLNKWVFKNE